MSVILAGIELLIRLHGHPAVGPLLRRIERQATVTFLRHIQHNTPSFKSKSGGRFS